MWISEDLIFAWTIGFVATLFWFYAGPACLQSKLRISIVAVWVFLIISLYIIISPTAWFRGGIFSWLPRTSAAVMLHASLMNFFIAAWNVARNKDRDQPWPGNTDKTYSNL